MAVTAYKTAGTAVSVDRDGKTIWGNPDNAKASDNAYTVNGVAKSDYTHWLRLTNFGFSTSDIPSGATIDGFDVKIERSAEYADNLCDSALYLRKTAGQQGNNKASATKWGTSDAEVTYNWTAGQFGALADTDVKDSGFGVDLSVLNDADAATNANVDCISVRVYYTPVAEPIAVAGRSSTETRTAIALDTEIALEAKTSTDTRIAIILNTQVACSGKAYSNTRAALAIDTQVGLILRSVTNTRAELALTIIEITAIALHSSTDTQANLTLNTLVSLTLRSSTDTVAWLALDTTDLLAFKSLSNTHAAISLVVEIILVFRSLTDTRAFVSLEVTAITYIACKSATDNRAVLSLVSSVLLALRSLSATRATVELTISVAPIADILAAILITSYSARIKGKVTDDKTYDCEVRFRWRELLGEWTETEWDDNGGSYYHTDDEFYRDLIGLDPETDYEYQTQARGVLV